MGPKYWGVILKMLKDNPFHRMRMGKALWTFMDLLEWVNPKTGVVKNVTFDAMKERNRIPYRTLQNHIGTLREKGYIHVVQHGHGMDIVILDFRQIRCTKTGVSENTQTGVPETPESAPLDIKGLIKSNQKSEFHNDYSDRNRRNFRNRKQQEWHDPDY